jgi:hypothetical protein
MVAYAARYLTKQEFRGVKADIPGHPNPELIRWQSATSGHIPDLTALGQDGGLFVFEVETGNSITDRHTADQWKLFSAHASQQRGEFWVVVPDGYKARANKRLMQLALRAKVWELAV